MDDPYPLKLAPKASPRLWGGSRLRQLIPTFAQVASDEPIGEAWLVYADNRIINGQHRGQTLRQLAAEAGAELLGSRAVARYGATVPLLAKLIDAADRLSIQVHPDDAYALRYEAASGHLGKAEAWYILEAAPGAQIIWGFNQDLSPDRVREAALCGELERYLNAIPVAAGEVIYNPPGTVHAIGAGILLFEIQQSSDLTYRLYDYQRRDASGQLRELHLDKALAVATLRASAGAKVTPKALGPQRSELVRTEHFVMERLVLGAPLELSTTPASLELLVVLRGHAAICHGDTLVLAQAEAAVLPAVLGSYQLAGEGELVRCYLP